MTFVKSLFLVMLIQTAVGSTQESPEPLRRLTTPLVLELEVTRRSRDSETNLVLINLTNESDSPVTKITFELFSSDHQPIDGRSIANLASGQSLSEKLNLPPLVVNPYSKITYTFENQEHSVMRSIIRPKLEQGERSPVLIPILTGLFNVCTALGGALLGAWIVNKYTESRERARNKFEWSKMLFEKYEGAYRTFLKGWGGSSSSIALESQFDIMKSNSLVPVTIEKAYGGLLTTLKGPSSPNEKTKACEVFRDEFDKFISNPWYG